MKLGMIDPNTNDINTDMDLDIGSTLADRYFHLNAQGFPTFAPSTCPLKSI